LDWQAGTSRTLAEAHAGRLVGRHHPDLIAPIIHVDEAHDTLVQRWQPGSVWKNALLDGNIDSATVGAVAGALSRIHDVDPASLDGRLRFETQRVTPYLRGAAVARPDLAASLHQIAEWLTSTATHLVHSDFSPKNIIVDPDDPSRITILDWEVAHR